MVNLEWLKSRLQTSAGTRARGTELVRLRSKRSVRRPLPSALKFFWTVLRPNPSFRRTEGICPASASVRFEKILTVRFHSLRNYQNDRFFQYDRYSVPKWPLYEQNDRYPWPKWQLLTKMTVSHHQNDVPVPRPLAGTIGISYTVYHILFIIYSVYYISIRTIIKLGGIKAFLSSNAWLFVGVHVHMFWNIHSIVSKSSHPVFRSL